MGGTPLDGYAAPGVAGADGPIHIHRNTLGDTSATAGAGDLSSTVHRWLNPVAQVTIVVPAS